MRASIVERPCEVKKLMGEIRDAWAQVPDLTDGQSEAKFGERL